MIKKILLVIFIGGGYYFFWHVPAQLKKECESMNGTLEGSFPEWTCNDINFTISKEDLEKLREE